MTVSPRVPLPTVRGRQTQVAIDAAVRAVIARKGILATTISDIAAEAGRSTASFYNYYDSKEAMVREWAISMMAQIVENAQRQGFCDGDDPHLVAVALVSMLNQFCYHQLSGDKAEFVDDDACVATSATIFHRTIYPRAAA